MSSATLHARPTAAMAAGDLGSPAPRGRFNRASVVLAVILVSQLMVVLDATIVNVALPDMQAALHFSTPAVLGAQRLHPDLRRPAAARRAGR